MNTLIARQRYTDLIAPFIGKNIIKVLTGQRRVGKSCILRQLQEQMRTAGANTIYINKEFDEFAAIRNNYPKYVVSLDEWTSGSNVEGIHHVHLADFLQMDL